MSVPNRVKFLIIGTGPCGLGAAYRLNELGQSDYLLLEREDFVGGLATSFIDSKGFTWDIGGHVQFSHYPYFDRVMDEALGVDGWLQHLRESWVWIRDRFVPYPFQNNIRFLPKDEMWRCLKGVIEVTKNPPKTKPQNFKEWIHAVFGPGIADEFMYPYNFKVWAYNLEKLAYQWIGERVSVIDVERVTENILFDKEDVSWGPNNKFRFPKHGGTGAIWQSVGEKIGLNKVRLKSEVVEIDPVSKEAHLKSGEKIAYGSLLSTVPLDQLAGIVKGLPSSLQRRAQNLLHSSTNIVGVGLKGQPSKDLETKCWMYFPENNCPFYRVTLFSKYSPFNVPDASKYFSLMTETSESPEKPVVHKQLIEQTVAGLRATKLISDADEVVATWQYHAPYGYPTPSLERDGILDEVIPALDKLGIYSRGRFGGWKYEVSNQDHTFMQGVEWVNRLVNNEPEATFRVKT